MDKDSAGMGTTMAERFKRALAMLLCCTVTWTSLPLYAQVVPVANPGGQQPGQQVAANGVPVVDIVAPNARGVSHNRYSRFDVGGNGLILNNSANIAKTELGGYIAGNGNLRRSGAATLILNEVTSTASRLQGYTEIAGARAQLVIANPNGISCDGCGFLNASRVTLATGTPQLGSDGALSGFSVTGGVLSIGSNGLDAYNVDRLDLLSRQLSVGGAVWAKDLLASTGSQRISYDGMLLEVLPGSDGAAPSLGIDVAYLGGMYADRIRLIATDAGVGVVSRGTLAAQAGSLQIDSAGQLSLSGTTVARDDVDLRAAGALTQLGTLGSQQAGVRLRAGQLSLGGDTIASGLLDARASGSVTHSGRSSAGAISLLGSELDVGGTLYSSGALRLDAGGNLRTSALAYAGGALALRAGGNWLQNAGTLQSGGALSVQAGRIDAAGVLDAGTGLALRSDGDMRLSGLAQSWQDAALQAGGRLDNAGQLSAAGRVDIAATAIGNAGVLSANGDVALATAGTLDNAGTVYAGRDLRIDAAAFANAGSSYAGRNADIATTAATDNRGRLVAGEALRVDAAQFASRGELGSQRGATRVRSRGTLVLDGTAAAAGGLLAQAAGDLYQSGTLDAGTTLTLHSDNAMRLAGTLQARGDVALDSATTLHNQAQVVAGGNLAVAARSLDNGSDAALSASGDATIASVTTLRNDGRLHADGALRLRAGSFAQAETGKAYGGASLELAASDVVDNRGDLIGGGDVRIGAGRLASGGQLGSQRGQVVLDSRGDLDLDGVVVAATALRGQALGDLHQRGSLQGQSVQLQAGGDLASAGALDAGTDLTLRSQGQMRLGGRVIAAQAVSANALGDLQLDGTLQGQSATLAAGRALSVAGGVQTAAGLALQAERALRVDGQALAGGDLTLRSAGALAIAGAAQAAGDIALDAGAALSNAGQVLAGRDLRVAAQSLDNAANAVLAAQGALQLATPGTVANAGSLQAGQAMTLDVGTLQHSGQAHAGDALALRASGAVDTQGDLIALGELQVDAASLTSSGQLGSETGQVSLTSQGDLRLGGTVAAATQLTARAQGDLLQAGALSAQALDLQAGGDAILAGQVMAVQSLQVQAQRDLHVDGQANAGQAASLSAGAALSTGSQAVLHSAGALALSGARIASQGALDAGTTLALSSNGDLALAGIAQSATTLNLSAGAALSNTAQVVAGTDLTLTAASVDTAANSLLAAQGDVTLTVRGALDNAGALRARQGLQLDVGSLRQSGQAYAGERLALRASGAVDTQGDLIAQGELQVDAASLASSGQLGSETGQVTLTSQGDLRLGGTVAAAGGVSAQAGGALSQTGTLSAATALQLQAHEDLTIAGRLSADQLTLGSDAALLQRGTVNGRDIAVQAQRIDNAGQTLSSGNLRLHAGDIAIGGVAAAGIGRDGRLGSSGTLDLQADRTLSAAGTLIAAGDLTAQATQLALAGSTTRVGGDASLSARNGLDHRGADLLAGGVLTVQAGGSLDNGSLDGIGGQLQAARLDLGAASLRNSGGTLVQSGSGQTRIALTGAFDNGNGQVLTNGQDLDLGAASLNNAQGRIEHAGTGTATLRIGVAVAVANAGGRLLSQGQLHLGANAGIDNQNGAIAAAGDATLTGASLSNVGGSVSARSLTTQLGGALDNRSGVLQAAGGTLTVRADSLDNRSGTLQALASGGAGGDLLSQIAHTLTNDGGLLGASNDATVDAENLSNNAGSVQAGRDLALTARGQLDNHQGGRLGGGRDLTVAVSGALLNRGGQLDSGNALTVTGGRLDNSQGAIANNGSGLTQLTTGGELRNAGGSLGGRGSVVLDAASVVNSDGQLVAGGDLVANTNSLDNQRGNLYAGNNFLLQRAGATLDNRSGTIKAEQAVRLTLQNLSNSGGRIGAGSTAGGAGDVVIDTVGLDGGGDILAQNLLDLTVRSDYTHGADADLTSNGDLRLNVGGNLVNASALKAARSLRVTANTIGNRAGATIQAANAQLTTGGTIDNAGDISASDTLQLTAGSLANTGSLVGGNVLIDTGTLVNGADLGSATDNAAYGSALIGATNGMTLLVRDQLLNRDAKIFSLGNIAIGAARDGSGTLTARTGVVNNLSGSIEADGSIAIAANQLNNRRRVVDAKTGPLSASERAAANQAMPEEELRHDSKPAGYTGHDLGLFRSYDVQERETLTAASAEGRIVAGGNIALSGSLVNNASTIAAGGALWINQHGIGGLSDAMLTGSESLANQALALKQTVNYTDTEYKARAVYNDCMQRPGQRVVCYYEEEQTVTGSGTSDASYTALAANMTGGQGVSINGATLSNGVVGSDGRRIGGAAFDATQGTALSRRSAQRASAAGRTAVQAHTGSLAGGATVSNRIAPASLSAIGIDDGHRALVGRNPAAAADLPHTTPDSLSGTGGQPIDPGTGNAPQVVGSIGAPLGNIVLPIGGLYRLVGANGARVNPLGRVASGLGGISASRSAGPGQRYLIETDPRFADYASFISSDYLLDKLGLDPQWMLTRLGDGFYEQRLVLDQITQLTGRRYLGNYDDGVAQYRALLDGAVAEAGALQLDVGVALTAEQVAALTHDIVWMVEQQVQGQKVLVPVLYLASKTALTLRSDGALLASDIGDVALDATAGLSNSGTLSGVNVSATTAGTLLNQGRIAGTGTVALQAQQDLRNLGGQIVGRDVLLSAGNDLLSTTRDAVAGGDLRSGISADTTLLMNAGHDLTLTGTTVQAGGSAALQAGNTLALQPTALRDEAGVTRGGDATSLTVGQDLSMVAGHDLQLHGVAIAAGGDAALQAGHDLSLTPVTDANGKATVRTSIVTDGSLQLAAGNDITLRQAEVKAGGDLIAAAGHDLNVTSVLGESTATTDHTRQGKTKVTTTTTTQDLDQQALTAGGNLILSAGNDVNLVATKLDAGKGLAVVAGNDINSTTLTTVDSSDTLETRKRFKQTTSTTDETVHGTEFTAGSDIALQAGHDVNLTAAKVYTDTGAVSVAAGNDVNLLAAQEQHDAEQDMQKKKKGFLSSKTTTTHDEWHDSTAVATTLSGDSVQIAAGHDLLSQGAQVAATNDVVIAAGNDLTLETAQNEHSEEHEKKTKKSGMFGSGGIGVTFGTQKVQNNADTTGVSHTGSTVGSVEGDVTLVAGNRYTQTGSDVLAPAGDITVKAKDIAITEVQDTTDAEQRSKFSQGGLSVTLSSTAISLAQSASEISKASKDTKGDTRMQALAAGSAAYSAYGAASSLAQTGSALASGSAQGAAQGANVSIAVTIGGSKSESKSTQSASEAKGSKLQAGGDVSLIATGGGDASNLLIRGSDISAGNNVLLAADHDVTIEAANNTAEQHSTSKSSSAAIGVAVTYGADGFAAGVTLSASGSRGKANGEDVSYTNSHVAAGNAATVISGNDTTLKGAQLSADKVVADVGGNLNIESLQDTSTYASKDKSMGGSVTFGMGFSASASYSSNKVNGDYASVGEQSGIQAGNGGFDIKVGGNTDLKGAVIASSQEAIDEGKNRLSTGTLTYSDMANSSSYDAKGISLSGGYSYGGAGGDDKAKGSDGQTAPTTNNGSNWSWQNFQTGSSGTAAGYGHESGDATSTTRSGISGGTLVITDESGQQAKTGNSVADTLAALKRDVVTGDDANGLTKQWDAQQLRDRVAAQAQITATFGQQATKAVGDYAQHKTDDAAALRQQADATSDPEQKAQLTAQAEQLESQWGTNGTLRVLAHTVVGGLTGGLDGATGAVAGTLTAPAVAAVLRDAGVTGPLADALTALASTAAGAMTGGTSGAATASNEVANNYLSHEEAARKALLEKKQSDGSISDLEKKELADIQRVDSARDKAITEACAPGNKASAACVSLAQGALDAVAGYESGPNWMISYKDLYSKDAANANKIASGLDPESRIWDTSIAKISKDSGRSYDDVARDLGFAMAAQTLVSVLAGAGYSKAISPNEIINIPGITVKGNPSQPTVSNNLGTPNRLLPDNIWGDGMINHPVRVTNPVLESPRVGSANKPADGQHGFNNLIDNQAGYAEVFSIPTKGPGGAIVRTSELRQLEGSNNGVQGVFEWIVDKGEVTHRRFIPGGKVTGYPNQRPNQGKGKQ